MARDETRLIADNNFRKASTEPRREGARTSVRFSTTSEKATFFPNRIQNRSYLIWKFILAIALAQATHSA
jgi:hypothetical protein